MKFNTNKINIKWLSSILCQTDKTDNNYIIFRYRKSIAVRLERPLMKTKSSCMRFTTNRLLVCISGINYACDSEHTRKYIHNLANN